MPRYRSALGKDIDMTRIASQNEHVRAVGNMKVNARGDTIDSNNRVVEPVTKKVNDMYQRTVTNRASNIIQKKNQNVTPDVTANQQPVDTIINEQELLPIELELEDDTEIDEIIRIKEEQNIVIKPASEAPDFVKPETTSKKK